MRLRQGRHTYLWARYTLLWATLLICVAMCRVTPCRAQGQYVLKLTDLVTHQPIAGASASVYVPFRQDYTSSPKGLLHILRPPTLSSTEPISMTVDHPLYHPIKYILPTHIPKDTLYIALKPIEKIVQEVLVERSRSTYRPEESIALQFVDTLVHNHKLLHQEYTYRIYDKLSLAVANFDLNNRLLNTLFPFFRNYVTPSKLNGRWALPLSIRETVYDVGHNPTDDTPREIIRYRERIGVDQNIDDGTMTQSLEEIFPRIDLFKEEIKLLDNRFISPLSRGSHKYYKYYLTDTVVTRGRVSQVIQYYPYNPRSFCFNGRIYLTSDKGQKHVLRCEMEVPKSINLNFVGDLKITQNFTEITPGRWAVDEEEMNVNLALFKKALALYAEHTRKYDRYDFATPDTLLTRSSVLTRNLSDRPEAARYGAELSSQPLLSSSDGARGFLEEVRQIPFYRFALDGAEMISRGYIRTAYSPYKYYGGSPIDIGPIPTFYTHNDIEGARLRFGGRTTGYFSPRLFISGYGAYGLADKQWKYNAQVTYSFKDKRYFLDEYPKHDLSLIHEYDLHSPGQIYNDNDKDNIFRNLGTSYLTSRSYRKTWLLQYRHDGTSGLSFELSGRYALDRPTGSLSYVYVQKDSTFLTLPHLEDVSVGVKLRYAPGERIYEGNLNSGSRRQQQRDLPVLTLQHDISMKIFGGNFYFNKTELGIEQRLWLSSYGNIDYRINVGKIWDNVPFPHLYTPPANSAIAYNDHSFQLLQPLEYVGDEYATAFVSYRMRGWLISRIPLLNRLNLRGVLSLNALYGNTSILNSTKTSKELFVLPPETTEMSHTTHVEVGFGFENILRFLRLDVFKRLTPPGPYGGSEYGIKGQLKFNF